MKERDLNWSWKTFDQITKLELYEILSFRQTVFVVEQKSWYQDADGLDQMCEHLLIKQDSILVGYLRLIPPEKKYKTPSIGRIAVSQDLRGEKIGSKLVKEGLRRSYEIYSSKASTISAQEYLIDFYRDHGFEVSGEVYDEDGIPHVKMLKNE